MPDPDTMTIDECRAFVAAAIYYTDAPLPPATIEAAIGVIEGKGCKWTRDTNGWAAWVLSVLYVGVCCSQGSQRSHTIDAWRLAAKVVMAGVSP